METSVFLQKTKTRNSKSKSSKTSIGIIDQYKAYCLSQGSEKMSWYMKTIIVIPCVIMVPSIIGMTMVRGNSEYYIALCMLLFFSNMLIHIAQFSSKYYVPMYHLTISLMIAIPFISYLVSL